MRDLRFAHISDMHLISGEPNALLKKLVELDKDPVENLILCLEAAAKYPVDFVLMTGDLVHDGEAGDYEKLRDVMEKYLPGVPVVASMGNHDNRAAFREGFLGMRGSDEAYLTQATVDGLRIVSVDSAYSMGITGEVPGEQMDWLEETIREKAPRGTLLCCHHPLIPMAGSMGLIPSGRFIHLVETSDIIGIFNGHIHSSFIGTYHGAFQVTADSLGVGAVLDAPDVVYNTRTGYHLCTLDADGNFLVDRRLVTSEALTLARYPMR